MATATQPPATYSLPQEFLDFQETIRKMVVERVAPRAAVRHRARGHRHRDADAEHRRRGGRQGVRLERADADDPGARDAPDQALRDRRPEAALPAEVRRRRVDAR